MPDCDIQLNSVGLPLRAMRGDMKQKAQLTLLFILHNVIPRSHLSDAPMNILGLLYCLHVGKDIDVARVIANEMKVIASSGVTNQSKPKCMLAFSTLIMGLIKEERIPIPQNFHELEKIDDIYVNRYCKLKRKETPTAPTHPTAPHDAMYRMSLQHPIDESTMFQTHIAWLGDRPNFVGGAGAEAGIDAEDDDIDAVAADAIDDDATQSGDGGDAEQYEGMSD
ncbi:hypothetical protein TSUD_13250 [Trifolium subterraneum]|uniref:Putative plant transposon protein domain-containing protein n=1 Tax=Trifolium subterraneum TaxID=3900 RepID=A0A2Z6PFK2_TRISU|nr:hypothetical protein TSUD_13250 [Trifolium subterraneum]